MDSEGFFSLLAAQSEESDSEILLLQWDSGDQMAYDSGDNVAIGMTES